jgi:ribose transport system permease protein
MNHVFFTPANLQIISRWLTNFALLGIGETLVIITGGIDLSLGSMVAFTNMLVAFLMVDMGLPIWLSIIIVLIVSILIGLYHGIFVTKLQVPPFIITLGTLMWARGLASYIKRGWIISGLPESFFFIGQGEIYGIPFQFLVLIVIALIVGFILRFTALGRYIFAVGGNIEAARLSGVHIDNVRIFCYVSSSFIAGITGVIVASRLSEGNPATGGSWELWAIAAAVIGGTSLFGGRGTILGTVIGASIMGVIVNGMVLTRVSSYLQDVVLGIILITAVTYDTTRQRREL